MALASGIFIRYADLLAAQAERAQGYKGRNARELLSDMDHIIAEAENAG